MNDSSNHVCFWREVLPSEYLRDLRVWPKKNNLWVHPQNAHSVNEICILSTYFCSPNNPLQWNAILIHRISILWMKYIASLHKIMFRLTLHFYYSMQPCFDLKHIWNDKLCLIPKKSVRLFMCFEHFIICKKFKIKVPQNIPVTMIECFANKNVIDSDLLAFCLVIGLLNTFICILICNWSFLSSIFLTIFSRHALFLLPCKNFSFLFVF